MKDTRTDEEKREALERRNKNLVLMKKYSDCTEEERARQEAIVRKGAEALHKKREKEKNLKEQALTLLKTVISKDDARKIIGDSVELIDDDEITIQSVLMISALKEATQNGNVKAMEFIRDTSGQKPKDAIEVDAQIMTDADKELIENVRKRLEKAE